MKVLLLSDSDSPHTLRWAKSLHSRGIMVGIFSIHRPNPKLYFDYPDLKLFSLNISRKIQDKAETNLSKLVYLKAISEVKKTIAIFKPDIVHAHYASSYGFLGAMTNFHPFFISVWGSDVFRFPKYSFLHKFIFTFSISRADKIFSTSRVMKAEIEKYTDKKIFVIPFGIDVERFRPIQVEKVSNDDCILIGTIKTLETRYGIEFLIRAFSILKEKKLGKKIKLLICGKGTLLDELKKLTVELGLQDDTIFTGYINHDDVQIYHNKLDIYVAPSLEESFGVAILEASACNKPVVVSDVGGLPEVVDHGVTGFIVEPKNPVHLASAIEQLIIDPELRYEMGRKGREKVTEEYDWNKCVSDMVEHYDI
ncbi:MAG: glycosyltransferase [Ignavibacterium sp.]|jgi:glycosyltransferase involved in cell wall biosynthesis|nr:glycosyltransferase [Ignavibacterium sp.]